MHILLWLILLMIHGPQPQKKIYTLPETNIAPENGSSQKETNIPTIYF